MKALEKSYNDLIKCKWIAKDKIPIWVKRPLILDVLGKHTKPSVEEAVMITRQCVCASAMVRDWGITMDEAKELSETTGSQFSEMFFGHILTRTN